MRAFVLLKSGFHERLCFECVCARFCGLCWRSRVVIQVQLLGLISVIRDLGGGIVSQALKWGFAFGKCFCEFGVELHHVGKYAGIVFALRQ